MAEAEDVITDVARHATMAARDLWRRHRKHVPGPDAPVLRDVAQRLDLLLSAVFGRSFALRTAQAPAPATLLSQVWRRTQGPPVTAALPATDGHHIWLPPQLRAEAELGAVDWYRVLALQQAMRACSGLVHGWHTLQDATDRAVHLVLQAQAADAQLARLLPGLRPALQSARAIALRQRPALSLFPAHRLALETLVRELMGMPIGATSASTTAHAVERARELAAPLRAVAGSGRLLYRDLWTGEVREPSQAGATLDATAWSQRETERAPGSARLSRRPQRRDAPDGEDDNRQAPWMVQTAQPHEKAEDPMGLQRPTDRDEQTAAEEHADALSELPEARLVTTPGRPKEVLLSDDAPEPRSKLTRPSSDRQAGAAAKYPEWDWCIQAYHAHGTTVHVRVCDEGPQAWVDATLQAHRALANQVKRRFEMLKAQRSRLRKQLEGDDLDLQACVDAWADFRAGLPLAQGLYQSTRQTRRDMAIVLLVDVSGSTDSWIAADKRIIDVEREALLLVSIALQGLAEPNAILAFSGDGPHGVTMRVVKSFDEAFGPVVARRIAALQPEHYTRAGAALRHATALLMQQPARHRLLLMLSDGKPNDIDAYEGRYGVEDMRQAAVEARLQGVQPFCLTVDRQAAAYLPAVFGAPRYALLPQPALLPAVLLDWMRRLVRT